MSRLENQKKVLKHSTLLHIYLYFCCSFPLSLPLFMLLFPTVLFMLFFPSFYCMNLVCCSFPFSLPLFYSCSFPSPSSLFLLHFLLSLSQFIFIFPSFLFVPIQIPNSSSQCLVPPPPLLVSVILW